MREIPGQLEPDLSKPARSQVIVSNEEGYSVHLGAVWLDVDAFQKRVEEGRRHEARMDLPRAIAAYLAADHLYRGDYLEEDLYEDWARGRREHLCEVYFELQDRLGDCYMRQRECRKAIACFQKVLAKDPFREEACRGLMRCYYHLGEQAGALKAFERCKKLLAEELEVEPMPQTEELYKQIRKRAIEIR